MSLLEEVERLFLREILTFEGERRVTMRVDGNWPDRRVFAVARLEDFVAVASVYEDDLARRPEQALQIIYMSAEDVDAFQSTVSA